MIKTQLVKDEVVAVKKPREVRAWQFNDWSIDALPDWLLVDERITCKDGQLVIHTLEGDMTASPGDYIIRGVQGEIYPCKADIFNETYEIIERADGLNEGDGEDVA